MRYLLACTLLFVEKSIIRACITFGCLHIEERKAFFALNALLTIEERSCNGAIGNVVILSATLVVLFDDIIDSLAPKDPIGGIKIGLKDSRTQESTSATVAMDDTFYGSEHSFLFLDIGCDLHNFWVALDLFRNGL